MTNPDSFQPTTNLYPQNNQQREDGQRDRHTILRDSDGLVVTQPPKEQAILVGVELAGMPSHLDLDDSLAELALLTKTAGVAVIGSITQRLETPNPATFIGTGKLEELHTLVLETGASVVIFDDELSPRQQREIEKVLGENIKVLDRTALILDIFAHHAQTREGAVQVELAQYEYRLPRLTRAWTHLARQSGGRAGAPAVVLVYVALVKRSWKWTGVRSAGALPFSSASWRRFANSVACIAAIAANQGRL